MIVTVDEVKTHLRIEHNEEDEYLEGLSNRLRRRRRITAGSPLRNPTRKVISQTLLSLSGWLSSS